MPVVVVATLTPNPDKLDQVREALKRTVAQVHDEPGCELYALHESGGSFIFVEQWADADALQTHVGAPAVQQMLKDIGDHLDGAPDIKILTPVVAGDSAKGQLRS